MASVIAVAVVCLELIHLWFWFVLAPGKVPRSFYDPSGDIPGALGIASMAVVGALILSRQRANRVGWILCAIAIAQSLALNLSVTYAALGLYVRPGSVPLPLWPPLLSQIGLIPGATLVLIGLPLFFPNGHAPNRRWLLVFVAPALAFLLVAPAVGDSTFFASQYHIPSPLAIPALTGYHNSRAGAFGALFLLIGVLLAFASLVVRYLRGGGDERHQIKWLLAAIGVNILVAYLEGAIGQRMGIVLPAGLTAIPVITIPAAIGVAVLKYRLYDIDVVISRTLVYSALAAFISAVYVGIVVGIGSLVGSGGRPNLALSIVATAVVAVAFQPVRERLQKIANRLVYGRRATPYEVLSEFSARVAESYAGEQVMPRMAKVLGEGTGAERAEVWLRAGNTLREGAAWPAGSNGRHDSVELTGQLLPELPGADRAVPVRHQGELLGALTVKKRPGESLTPIEEKLLEDLAHQAGLVLKNVGLTADLQARLEDLRASRQRLVKAQDDERRKLERNLHDGAQQHLVAIKVKLGLAEMLAVKDPEKAKQTLEQLKGDADEALSTLRDLARGIYPPLLADRGLVVALEAQAGKATVAVAIEAEGVGRYPQEVEAAVYFCVLEALQNVQKYAHATLATVRLLDADGGLTFEVTDNGRGYDPAVTRRGSGLQNIADRLEALGGSLTVVSAPGRGVRLGAALPALAALHVS